MKTPDKAKLPCVIFDLDGTLADCTHRRHLVEGRKKDFDAFHEAAADDTPNEAIAWLFRSVRNTRATVGSPAPWEPRRFPVPVICTGRPERYRAETNEWLVMYCLVPHALYMRPDGDSHPDEELKREFLRTIRLSYDPLFVVDDRDKMVAMWREEGLTCLQCAPGNF